MNFISEDLENYVTAHSQTEPELLQKLNKETWQKVLNPRMLSGAYQGRLLALISKLKNPKTILEIGTYTGYSALCLAEGLQPNGTLITIDKNEELTEISSKYFNLSSYKTQIKPIVGNALEVIPTRLEKFDLVFIDADKSNYSNYFKLVLPKMNSGGIILSDNVLWSGKVLNEAKNKNDKDSMALIEYNQLLNADKRVETILLPIRDGLSVTRVK